ncbi:cation diffusion facilitator family transporter [Archaeoglobus veneficus]|uniref:Cation diffusion facilitator family transporter n=1 Tax=Archaeoglobus veneficus (strain DSM 11195 / SNP6) TaxID=693661 RepID=F2KS74_ARCVS|nr:cation diffusion facilitator family transporter [Archaeoglobus veneficus]AEA48013.1 cation diffusion facilitator family transporter [Archaeoglobus veneficus SNP6]
MQKVLLLYIVAFALKITGYLLTGYLILLADAMHSVTDIATILLLMYSGRVSKKPADSSHPFGHELARNVASLVAATSFITIVSFELLREGFLNTINPQAEYGDATTAVVVELTVLAILLVASVISSRKSGVLDRTMFVESINDSLSTVAGIAGILLISHGYGFFDGLVVILIALMILYNSIRLFKQNARFLLGLSPPDEFYHRVEEVSLSFDEIKGVHDMVAVYIGEGKVHLDMHITVDGRMSVEEADKLSERLVQELRRKIPEIGYVNIHVCPHFGKHIRKTL